MRVGVVAFGLGCISLLGVNCSSSTPAAVDSGHVADSEAGCTGLEAGVSGLKIPSACEVCISKNCCMQALTCGANAECKDIVSCELACVSMGTAPATCAMQCIAGDGGMADAALTPGQTAAESLSLCLGSSCSTLCS
jgi:hypothetical protein